MNPQIALAIFSIGIVGLFLLDWDRSARTSKALWIPVIWLLIAGPPNTSECLQVQTPSEGGAAYLEGSPLDRNVLTGLIVAGLAVLFSRQKRVGELLRANLPIVLFFLYCGASIFWSDFADVAFKRWIRALGDIIM